MAERRTEQRRNRGKSLNRNIYCNSVIELKESRERDLIKTKAKFIKLTLSKIEEKAAAPLNPYWSTACRLKNVRVAKGRP